MIMLSDKIKSDAVAIIGMCKNAGKTTVLNSLVGDMAHLRLAITSIGRDGENVDVATNTEKPGIYVGEGTVFATARALISLCDASIEVLDTTDINTSLGEVVLLKARSDGNIQIAGPSTVEGLVRLYRKFTAFGVDRVIFDGAISRKSLSVPSLCKEIVLCSGASYSKSIAKTVADTAFIAKLFSLEIAPPTAFESKFLFVRDDDKICCGDTNSLKGLLNQIKPDRLYINGAVTDVILNTLLESGVKNISVAAKDPSRYLVSEKLFEMCAVRNIKFNVEDKAKLVAITVNPFSAYGLHYDSQMFFDEMCKATQKLALSVFDVKGGINHEL